MKSSILANITDAYAEVFVRSIEERLYTKRMPRANFSFLDPHAFYYDYPFFYLFFAFIHYAMARQAQLHRCGTPDEARAFYDRTYRLIGSAPRLVNRSCELNKLLKLIQPPAHIAALIHQQYANYRAACRAVGSARMWRLRLCLLKLNQAPRSLMPLNYQGWSKAKVKTQKRVSLKAGVAKKRLGADLRAGRKSTKKLSLPVFSTTRILKHIAATQPSTPPFSVISPPRFETRTEPSSIVTSDSGKEVSSNA